MRFLVVATLTALIAGPAIGADRHAERIVTRHIASIVPPDGSGGVAVALPHRRAEPVLQLRLG